MRYIGIVAPLTLGSLSPFHLHRRLNVIANRTVVDFGQRLGGLRMRRQIYEHIRRNDIVTVGS